MMFLLWSLAALGAVVYCIARATADLRQRKYGWAMLGIGSALVFLLAPVTPQTHAVKVDVPQAAPR